jgi:hypothetical protein
MYLTLRGELRQMPFGSRALWRIFRPNREEVSGDWKQSCNFSFMLGIHHIFGWLCQVGRLLVGRHNQIDHILIERRRHSSILDVRSFRAADCDTEHYLVVAMLGRDLQWVNKGYSSYQEKLNEVEGKEQYCVEISNRFTALENWDTEVDTNSAWGIVRANIVTCASAGRSFSGRVLMATQSTRLLWLSMKLLKIYPW